MDGTSSFLHALGYHDTTTEEQHQSSGIWVMAVSCTHDLSTSHERNWLYVLYVLHNLQLTDELQATLRSSGNRGLA